MTEVLTARIPQSTAERVRQYAKRRQRSINQTVAVALEEWLRQTEFTYIEFRDTPGGRVAAMRNSRLPVFWVVRMARSCGWDVGKLRALWPDHPRGWIEAALEYYRAFPDEIDEQITQYDADSTLSALRRYLPEVEVVEVPAADPANG